MLSDLNFINYNYFQNLKNILELLKKTTEKLKKKIEFNKTSFFNNEK